MRLLTLDNGTADGELALTDAAHRHVAPAGDLCGSMREALERWSQLEPALQARAEQVERGTAPHLRPWSSQEVRAPLPRAFQWLDGSAYLSHGELMARVFHIDNPQTDRPLMYQGLSHQFLSATEDVALPSESDGIDFEGEFGIITDAVPMGIPAAEAARHIRLLVQINDWSLRTLAPIEMKTGFGWIQAKPACSLAPVAVTPETIGASWSAGRTDLTLHTWWNGKPFGAVRGGGMQFSFAELVAHAARTRALCAGTIIGSGTVSVPEYRQVGSSCIAERRAIELLDEGAARTGYMRFGDRVRMEARDAGGATPFGAIDQAVVRAARDTITRDMIR